MARGKWLSDEEKQRIKRMSAEGLSPAQIAVKLERGIKSIKRVLGSAEFAARGLTKDEKSGTACVVQRVAGNTDAPRVPYPHVDMLEMGVQPCIESLPNKAPSKVHQEVVRHKWNSGRAESTMRDQEVKKATRKEHIELMDAQGAAVLDKGLPSEDDDSFTRTSQTDTKLNGKTKRAEISRPLSHTSTRLPTSALFTTFDKVSAPPRLEDALMSVEYPQISIGRTREVGLAYISSSPSGSLWESRRDDSSHDSPKNMAASDPASAANLISDDSTQGSMDSGGILPSQVATQQCPSATYAEYCSATQMSSSTSFELMPKRRKLCSNILEKAMREMENAIDMVTDNHASNLSGARLRLIFKRFQADIRLVELDRIGIESRAEPCHKSRPTENEISFRV